MAASYFRCGVKGRIRGRIAPGEGRILSALPFCDSLPPHPGLQPRCTDHDRSSCDSDLCYEIGGERGDGTDGFSVKPIRPWRMILEKSGLLSAALAAALMCACSFRADSGRPSVTKLPCSYIISSILPLSRMRQSKRVRTLRASAAYTAMLVVQLLVKALYHSGRRCRLLIRSRYSRRILRARGGLTIVRNRYTSSSLR